MVKKSHNLAVVECDTPPMKILNNRYKIQITLT